jgi:hypothetical protein
MKQFNSRPTILLNIANQEAVLEAHFFSREEKATTALLKSAIVSNQKSPSRTSLQLIREHIIRHSALLPS